MKVLIALFFFALHFSVFSQVSTESDLFKTLARMDSVIFEVGYNQCNTDSMATALADDLTMYHDKAGVASGGSNIAQGIKMGICEGLNYKATRRLKENSLKVYPLMQNEDLYGAIQMGEHQFFAQYPDSEDIVLTSTAKFTHLWLLKDGQWKLKDILSYDHIAAE